MQTQTSDVEREYCKQTTITSLCIAILLTDLSYAAAQDTKKGPASKKTGAAMKIKLVSILLEDQEGAEKFYTDILRFVLRNDLPLGEFKWLTVVSPEHSQMVVPQEEMIT